MKRFAELQLYGAAAVWGFAFVAQIAGMDHVGPMTFIAVRFLLGALVLVPLIAYARAPYIAGETMAGVVSGILLFAGSALQQVAMLTTTAGKAAFITGLYMVFVPVFLYLFWRERAGMNAVFAIVLSTIGLFMLTVKDGVVFQSGDLLVLGCAVVFALYVIATGRYAGQYDPLRLAALQFLVCAGLAAIAALATESPAIAGIKGAWLSILYAGIVSSGIAYTLQIAAQRHVAPTKSAIILSLEAVFGAFAGWLLLGELLSPIQLTGCGLMFAGILLVQLGGSTTQGVESHA